MHRCAGWLDAILSRAVIEPRFVARQPSGRVVWLAEMLSATQRLSEDDWFAAPPSLELCRVVKGRFHEAPTRSISWELPTIGASDRLGIVPRSGQPSVTLYGDQGKFAWILLHGWLGGNATRDRHAWPFERLLKRADVLHVVLPGHGSRKSPSNARFPTFPSRNPVANAIGLALAVAELRQLVGWLRKQGYRRLGIAGTSLGGYVASLYATTSDECDRLLLDRPLVRMSEPLRRVARRRGAEYRELLTLLDAIYAPVSPLERPLRLPEARIDLLLGREDRISGLESGEALANHFGVAPDRFAGGHVLPLGRSGRLWERFLRLELSSIGSALR